MGSTGSSSAEGIADALAVALRAWFAPRAATFGLREASLGVAYVLNWGGFVNHSFRVSDGHKGYHVKLSTDEEGQQALRRWRLLGSALEPYRAPSIVDWVDLGVAEGLVFSLLPGRVPALSDAVVDAILQPLAGLWADRDLALVLASGAATTAGDAFQASFDRRFREDLAGIRAAPPPFVSRDLIQWLEGEVDRLAGRVRAEAVFGEELRSPVHGDLWLNNVLWVDRDSRWLLDWDDLRIGDPAADVASLLGPSAGDLRPLKRVERAAGLLTVGQRARLPLLGQATLLDWVIDPLSDWIDADTSPAHAAEVRAEKERVHQAALGLYRGWSAG
jgi:hypothetical protein